MSILLEKSQKVFRRRLRNKRSDLRSFLLLGAITCLVWAAFTLGPEVLSF